MFSRSLSTLRALPESTGFHHKDAGADRVQRPASHEKETQKRPYPLALLPQTHASCQPMANSPDARDACFQPSFRDWMTVLTFWFPNQRKTLLVGASLPRAQLSEIRFATRSPPADAERTILTIALLTERQRSSLTR